MENNKQLKLLTDILTSIEEIELYAIKEIHTNKKEFLSVPAQRLAERNLEIIGEAINKLIHDYDGVDPQLIIPIIDEKLQLLKIEILNLIEKYTTN